MYRWSPATTLTPIDAPTSCLEVPPLIEDFKKFGSFFGRGFVLETSPDFVGILKTVNSWWRPPARFRIGHESSARQCVVRFGSTHVPNEPQTVTGAGRF